VRPLRIGGDEVTRDGDRLVVVAAREMPDWEVRKARKAQIRFRDALYFPAEATPLGGGRVRYVLHPWPERTADVPGPRLTYDAGYVRRRDLGARLEMAGLVTSPALWMLGPLIGLLPSWIKAILHDRFALHRTTVTRHSLYLQFATLLVMATLWCIRQWVGGIWGDANVPGTSFPLIDAVMLTIALDLICRAGRLLSGKTTQWGFGEWLYGPVVGWLRKRLERGGS